MHLLGLAGQKGEMGDQGMRGIKGLTGPLGATGPTGPPGPKGEKGDQEDVGTVYVRWGHDQCPSTAQLVYSGRAGGASFDEGGASNPQCLPLDPNFLPEISGDQVNRGLMYGAEYHTHTDSNSHLHGRHAFDVPCAVCYVTKHSTVYMLPAKHTCPSGWTREYYGYLMSDHHNDPPSEYICVDNTLTPVKGSEANVQGMYLHFVEGRCGSLPCPPYDNTKELSCAVCTK